MNLTKRVLTQALKSGRFVSLSHTIASGDIRIRKSAFVESIHPKYAVLITDKGYRTVRFASIQTLHLHG